MLNMFKITIVSFAIIAVTFRNAVAITDEQKSQIQSKFLTAGAGCIVDHPLSTTDVTAFKNKQFPESDNAGCFAACLFKKIGLFDDKGTVSHEQGLENAKQIFDGEDDLKNVGDLLTTCAKVNEEDVSDGEKGCDRARLAFSCLVENAEKFGFNVDF